MEDWTSCIRWMQCQPFWPTEVHEQEQSDPQRGQSCHMCQSAAARLQLRCKPTRRRPPHLVVAQHKVALAGSQVDAHSWVLGPGVRHLCRCTSGTSRAAHEAETGGHLASRQACGWKLAGHMGSRHACIHSALSNRLPGTHPGAHGLPAVAARGVPAHQYGVRASDEPTSGTRVVRNRSIVEAENWPATVKANAALQATQAIMVGHATAQQSAEQHSTAATCGSANGSVQLRWYPRCRRSCPGARCLRRRCRCQRHCWHACRRLCCAPRARCHWRCCRADQARPPLPALVGAGGAETELVTWDTPACLLGR